MGTPAGVFQAGHYISGPLGLIRSRATRYVPPTRTLQLWHCSDTGCGAVHDVFLRPESIPVVDSYERIGRVSAALGPKSNWRRELNRLFLGPDELDGRPWYDFPVVLANGILGTDREALLRALFQSSSAPALRAALTTGNIDATGSPDTIVNRIDEATQLQALLVLTNDELQPMLDACIFDNRISIPFTEIRDARIGAPKLTNRDRPTQISSLGVRSKPRVPLALLHTVVWNSYEGAGLLEELGWKLRRKPGLPSPELLMEFIRTNNPEQVVLDLILSSMPVTRSICDRFRIRLDALERTAGITDILLWKLGFNPTRFVDYYPTLRSRIDEFTSTILSLPEVRTEDERARIRSVGVNLFISVEQFVQDLVSYNTWLLASDHFVTTRFTYTSQSALSVVPTVLGPSLQLGDVEVSWRSSGENALGTLLGYAQRLIEWASGLPAAEKSAVARSIEDLPHYVYDVEQSFVFTHTALWADADPAELQQYVNGLGTIVSQLNRAQITGVRNGLDHRRDAAEFPKPDIMLVCATRLREAFDLADTLRYVPKVFWLRTRTTDRFGRSQFTYVDYRGKEIVLSGPPVVSGLSEISFTEPAIIAAGNLLGAPNAQLRFSSREPSVYASYWEGYPRRRRIPSPHQLSATAGADHAS